MPTSASARRTPLQRTSARRATAIAESLASVGWPSPKRSRSSPLRSTPRTSDTVRERASSQDRKSAALMSPWRYRKEVAAARTSSSPTASGCRESSEIPIRTLVSNSCHMRRCSPSSTRSATSSCPPPFRLTADSESASGGAASCVCVMPRPRFGCRAARGRCPKRPDRTTPVPPGQAAAAERRGRDSNPRTRFPPLLA